MGNEGHSGSECMPSLGDVAPQTWVAGQSVPQHAKAGTQPMPQQLKRKPGEIGEAGPRENKKRIDKAYRERVKQEKLKIKDERDKLASECEQLKANLKGITDEKQKLELLAENQRLRLVKQHSDEIRSLEKQHSDEIRRLEKDHFDEIRSLQKQLSDAIVKKEQSDYEIKSLKKELDEKKKKVQELSAFNNWKTGASLRQRNSTRRFKPTQIFSSSRLQSGETLRSPDSSSTKFFFEKELERTDMRKGLIIPTHFLMDLRTMQTLRFTRSHIGPSEYRDDGFKRMEAAESVWKLGLYIRVRRSKRSVFQSGYWVVLYETEQPEWPVQGRMDHLREDQPVYAHAAKDLAPAAHLHVGNARAGSYSGTGTDDFSELSPFLDLPSPDFPQYG